MISHADLRDMIASYALGALDEPELGVMEEHLSECAFCANLAREAAGVTHQMAFSASYRSAPPGSLDRLLRSVDVPAPSRAVMTDAPAAEEHKRRWQLPAWLRSPASLPVAASMAVALGLAGWNWDLMQELHADHDEMTTLHQRIGEQSHLLVMVTSQTAETRALQSTALAPSAEVRLIMDGETNSAMLMASHLPPLPNGDIYEVWLGKQGARMPACKLSVDQLGDGDCNLQMDQPIHSYDSAWITLEPAAGGFQPNGPGVAAGAI